MFLPCRPCCGEPAGCGNADGKPRTDPKDEGTWVPSGTWDTGVTWTFVSNPGDESGNTWFFYGSSSTSSASGTATTAEEQDWGNICNWYSLKDTTPSSLASLKTYLSRRATRLPPEDAVVHIYTNVNLGSISRTVSKAYFWNTGQNVGLRDGTLTCTGTVHDATTGSIFLNDAIIKSTGPTRTAIVNGGATFRDNKLAGYGANYGIVNDGGVFHDATENTGEVNGGCVFYDSALNNGYVAGLAVFRGTSRNERVGDCLDDAEFYDSALNAGLTGIGVAKVRGTATFNDTSQNGLPGSGAGECIGLAIFNNSSVNTSACRDSVVFNGTSTHAGGGVTIDKGNATYNDNATFTSGSVLRNAVFNDNSQLTSGSATVYGTATFNDNACSRRFVGSWNADPLLCTKKFVAHPTNLPVCSGAAPSGCTNPEPTCGCQ